MTNVRKHVLRGCLLIALLLGACAPPSVNQRTPEPVQLKVLLRPYLTYAPFFIAEEEGYFAEQGLQIDFIKMTDALEPGPALAQGELDVGGGGLTPGLLNAMARGARISFVADKGYIAAAGCTSTALMARRALVAGGELESPAHLQGRRISLNPVSPSGYCTDKLLNTAGLTLDDIERVDAPPPVQLEAFQKGMIDLSFTQEPWVTRILQAGQADIWMPAQQVIPDFQLAVIAFGPTILDENPDAGRRFMVAYLKAVRQYNEGKTERNLDILAKHTGLDRGVLIQACWSPFRDDGQINVQSVLDYQAWAVEKGYLDSLVTEEQFWDPSFIEYANQILDTSSQ